MPLACSFSFVEIAVGHEGAREGLGDGPLLDCGLMVARALRHCHDLNVCHRDIKPDNILVMEYDGTSAFVVLADFGISRHMRAIAV